MKIRKITFQGWKNCIELSSGDFRIVATTEIGPRIIGGFLGDSENIFHVYPKTAGKKGGKEWNNFGGHRLWHSPEARPRSYTLDNFPVEFTQTKNSLIFRQEADDLGGLEKIIEVSPAKNNAFKVVHKLINRNPWPITCAAWALSVMAPGGTAILPMPQGDKKSLLPNTYITLWPYNTMDDGRCTIGSKYTLLRQNPKAKNAIKIGYNCEDGWVAYQNKGITFLKKFDHVIGAEYPDNGCSIECYTCADMQEMETLSPLYDLEPGAEIVHTEIWNALKLGSPAIQCEKDAVEVFG